MATEPYSTSEPLPEFAEVREAVYFGGKKVFSDDYFKRSPLVPGRLVHG